MAEKAKKNNKNLIIGIVAAVVVVVVVIVAVVLATSGSKLSDSYFVSDGSKYVLTMSAEEMSLEDDEYAPLKAHVVYFYSGDEITGLKTYYEYADAGSAKTAFDALLQEMEGEDVSNYALDGKYIIITSDESEYSEMTVDDVKQQIEFYEMYKNMDFSEDEDDVVEIEDDGTETTNEDIDDTEEATE